MNIDKKLELIKRNTEEILGEDELKELLKKKKPVVYWGTAITGKPQIAYFLPMLKIADFLKAGFKVKILLADLHGALDNCPWSDLEKRFDYYKEAIPLMVKAIGMDVKDLEIVKGSEFQLKPEYMYDVLRMSSYVSMRDAHKATSEVVKQGKNTRLSGLIYPVMQALDEVYLKADVQYAGLDQRKIMVMAREFLPKIGYHSRVEVMTPMIQGLIGKKMSASDEKSKIDLLDDEKEVERKIKNAEMVAGNPDNGVMAFIKYVVRPIKQDSGKKLKIERDKKYGGNIEYENYEELEEDYKSKKLHPLDLKMAVVKEINIMLNIFRKEKNKKKLIELAGKAYG